MFKIFGRHYGTERFFFMLFTCLLIMIGLTGYAVHVNNKQNQQKVSSTALYTSEYTWSRTSATGEVVSLMASEDRQRVFMLLKNDQNAANSFDASKYTVFMSNRDRSEFINIPKLTIYSYANSGYVGFYFSNAAGFDNQVISLIIRNDSTASDMANDNTMYADAERDVSFQEHNQIRIYANFGASGMETLDILNDPNANHLKLFADTAKLLPDGTDITQSYKTYTSNAQSKLMTMSSELTEIYSCRERLESMGVQVPDLPYYIKNDVVNTSINNFEMEPYQFASEMLDGDSAGTSGTNFLVSEKTETIATETDASTSENVADAPSGAKYINSDGVEVSYYYLHTDYLYPGTVSLDWQGRNLSYGFITQTNMYKESVGISMYNAYTDYTDWKSICREYAAEMPTSVSYPSWRYADGSYVDMTIEGDLTGEVSEIRKYEMALNNYLKHKREYYDIMDQILALESKVQNMGKAVTINSGTDSKPNLYTY